MTTRGLQKNDFETIANFVDRTVKITASIKSSMPATATKLKDFKEAVGERGDGYPEIGKLRADVTAFARKFPVIGFGSQLVDVIFGITIIL